MSRQCSNLRILVFATLAAALMAVPTLAQVVEVPSEKIPGSYDPIQAAAEQEQLAGFLLAEEGKAAVAGHAVQPNAKELERLENAPADQGRLLVGVTQELGIPVRFDAMEHKALSGSFDDHARGAVRISDDGFVWFTTVRSEGASAVRLHFTDFFLPRGAELYVYNRNGEAFGPYLGKGALADGEFWSHTVSGPEIRVQLRYEGRQAEEALRASELVIEDVVHMGENFLIAGFANPDGFGAGDKSFCSFNASCVQNASCSSIPSAIQPAQDAVAHLVFTVGSSAYICSGGLLNDTDGSTTIPYFLTANHCFSTSSAASSLEAYFQFTTSCGGACSSPGGSVPRVLGSTLLSTSSTGDYTFLELSSSAPAGSTLLGWSTTAVAFSNGTSLYRVSHPKGAPQAYSTHSVDTGKGTCSSWPRGDWIYSADTYGATEGGSSGSPVLSSSGQVVGQLSGACGSNPSNPCATSSNATVDGAFANYFSNIESWLDPSTGCHSGAPGSADYCSSSCQCEDGEGDCDSDSECVSGTTCVSNVGPNYGWASWVDVCEAGSDPNSCVGNCGSQAPGGCWCDSSCSFYGDCCSDKVAVCG